MNIFGSEIKRQKRLSESAIISKAIISQINDSTHQKRRILVYSHDTFGLGNIRRILSICELLLSDHPNISMLLITDSPLLHYMRISDRLDYIEIPCLNHNLNNCFSVQYSQDDMKTVVKRRSNIIYTTTEKYKPDIFVIDKNPYGIENELEPAIKHLHEFQPDTKLVLLLLDILDDLITTQGIWKKNHFHEVVEKYYNLVLVDGMQVEIA